MSFSEFKNEFLDIVTALILAVYHNAVSAGIDIGEASFKSISNGFTRNKAFYSAIIIKSVVT